MPIPNSNTNPNHAFDEQAKQLELCRPREVRECSDSVREGGSEVLEKVREGESLEFWEGAPSGVRKGESGKLEKLREGESLEIREGESGQLEPPTRRQRCNEEAREEPLQLREASGKAARQAGADPLPVLVGSGFTRDPIDATPRYTAWINGLTEQQLVQQRLRELTVIHPTWFCHRHTYERLGGLSEAGAGFPEDLDFFYRHLRNGGALARVPEPLLVWRLVIVIGLNSSSSRSIINVIKIIIRLLKNSGMRRYSSGGNNNMFTSSSTLSLSPPPIPNPHPNPPNPKGMWRAA
ncbi:hypothetical protein T492DRAFT_494426 [Pavlovales sp. CCMP2436]|nr:hypothetical protein T492DRAFT_494426 [Pavlovales sp. CCMP2436]